MDKSAPAKSGKLEHPMQTRVALFFDNELP
jgi:hypothetical protein